MCRSVFSSPLVLVLALWLALPIDPAAGAEKAETVAALAARLERDIAAVQALSERIADAPEHAREPLTFRRDERSLQLLVLFDQLTRAAAELPVEDATRKEVEQLMGVQLGGIGDANLSIVRLWIVWRPT